MKSIRTKILTLVLSGVLISMIVTVFISLRNTVRIMEKDSTEIMSLLCSEQSSEIDEKLRSIEQSVSTIYHFAHSQRGDVTRLSQDQEYLDDYIQKVKEVALDAAENTDGAIAVYFRLNPDMADEPVGLFMTMDENGEFYDFPLTDIAAYEEDDVEHVGWYYIPIHNGKATWMEPYDNKNLDIQMISYVIPIIDRDYVVGVIGMDIRVDLLYDKVNSVQVYDHGYAFLTDQEGNIITHKDYPDGGKHTEDVGELRKVQELALQAQENNEVVTYEWQGVKKRLASQELRNGMIFSVCVPEYEIEAPGWKIVYESFATVAVVLLIFLFITIHLTGVIVRPLKQLTEAAQEIANVNLDVSIECKTKDEVGVLAESFKQTAERLRYYIDYINQLAYIDVLTRLKNKTAYEECVEEISDLIEAGTAEFAVAVMDVNNLKKMNDTYGHEKGDLLIQEAAKAVCSVWNIERAYRIGGDEFAAILVHKEIEGCKERVALFDETVEKINQQSNLEVALQVAIGIAVYDKTKDCSYADVFRRADERMYQDKARKKGVKSL